MPRRLRPGGVCLVRRSGEADDVVRSLRQAPAARRVEAASVTIPEPFRHALERVRLDPDDESVTHPACSRPSAERLIIRWLWGDDVSCLPVAGTPRGVWGLGGVASSRGVTRRIAGRARRRVHWRVACRGSRLVCTDRPVHRPVGDPQHHLVTATQPAYPQTSTTGARQPPRPARRLAYGETPLDKPHPFRDDNKRSIRPSWAEPVGGERRPRRRHPRTRATGRSYVGSLTFSERLPRPAMGHPAARRLW